MYVRNSLHFEGVSRFTPRAVVISAMVLLTIAGKATWAQVDSAAASSQTAPTAVPTAEEEEIARLRPYIGAKPEDKINLADVSKLTCPFPIKVFFSTGLDMKVRKNMNEWADDWKKKNEKKYGAIEVVADRAQADVIIVRYTLINQATQEVYKSSYSAGTYTVVPVFGYVVERAKDGFTIVYRYVDSTPIGESSIAGKWIWDPFEDLMKHKAEDDKKAAKSKDK